MLQYVYGKTGDAAAKPNKAIADRDKGIVFEPKNLYAWLYLTCGLTLYARTYSTDTGEINVRVHSADTFRNDKLHEPKYNPIPSQADDGRRFVVLKIHATLSKSLNRRRLRR